VIDVNRFVAIELKPPVDFLAAESLRFLLRHPNEYDGVAYLPALSETVGDIVFPLFVPELVHRNTFLFRH